MSHPAPIPCAHCGTNFMRRDLDPDAPKLCNTCVIKDQQRNPKGEQKMANVNLLIECDRATQIEIEELCTNRGLSLSGYLIGLHNSTQGKGEGKVYVEVMYDGKSEEIEQEKDPVMVRQRKSRGGKK